MFTLDKIDDAFELIGTGFVELIDDIIAAKASGEISSTEAMFILDQIDDDLHAMMDELTGC